MRKQYIKESLGRIDGSLSSAMTFTAPHSPEDEARAAKFMDIMLPIIQYTTELALEENLEFREGDFIQYVIQYINNYFTNITNIIGQVLTAGNGIQISGDTISVRDGDGLDASSGDLDVDLATTPGLEISSAKLKVKAGDGITIDSNGTKIDDDGTNQFDTEHRATGCGLSFTASDGSGKVRVKPTDFLYTSDDD